MTESARSSDRHPPHGSMADEAAKLVDVAHLWLAAQSARSASAESGRDVWAEATAEAPPPECQGCPYCRVRRALGDVSPEVYQHLAEAVSSLGAALRALEHGHRR